jgi:prepilin-type processing-associated H-X9-DG protein
MADSGGTYGAWMYKDIGNAYHSPEGGAIFPYVKSAQVYVCPSDSFGQQWRSSLEMNGWLAWAPLSAIEDPTGTVILSEAVCDDGTCTNEDGHGGYERRNLGANFAFSDGHAKWVRGSNAERRMFTPRAD